MTPDAETDSVDRGVDGAAAPGDIDPVEEASRTLANRIREYEHVERSDAYRAQQTYLNRLTRDFLLGIRTASLAFTRYPEGSEWLRQRFAEDFVESAVSIITLGREGIFNVGRREMRYMVEAAVKYVYVDQLLPSTASVIDRLAVLADTTKVPRSSVEPVDLLAIRMLPDPQAFASAVRSAFGALSSYTHLSRGQLEERLRRAERGEYSGFESADILEPFNRLVFQVYDLVLALAFEGIGPALTGDIFINIFDGESKWKFHKGRFVSQVSRYFDYKVERQAGPG